MKLLWKGLSFEELTNECSDKIDMIMIISLSPGFLKWKGQSINSTIILEWSKQRNEK